jgi:hypothetical protein
MRPMRPHPDQLKRALPIVLEFRRCESRQEASDEAKKAIASGLGVDLEESQRVTSVPVRHAGIPN